MSADNLSITVTGDKVIVNFNGREKRFAVASVKAIEFHGPQGDDRFINHTSIAAAVAYGCAGDDISIGGTGTDELHGQDGHDTSNGRGGHDILFGQAGHDWLEGHAGDLLMVRGRRPALLRGMGTDLLRGDDGNDRLYGENGDYCHSAELAMTCCTETKGMMTSMAKPETTGCTRQSRRRSSGIT